MAAGIFKLFLRNYLNFQKLKISVRRQPNRQSCKGCPSLSCRLILNIYNINYCHLLWSMGLLQTLIGHFVYSIAALGCAQLCSLHPAAMICYVKGVTDGCISIRRGSHGGRVGTDDLVVRPKVAPKPCLGQPPYKRVFGLLCELSAVSRTACAKILCITYNILIKVGWAFWGRWSGGMGAAQKSHKIA